MNQCMVGEMGFYSELGTGLGHNFNFATLISTLPGPASIISRSMSGEGACVLVEWHLMCWGWNDLGQLGIGTFGGSYDYPVTVVGY